MAEPATPEEDRGRKATSLSKSVKKRKRHRSLTAETRESDPKVPADPGQGLQPWCDSEISDGLNTSLNCNWLQFVPSTPPKKGGKNVAHCGDVGGDTGRTDEDLVPESVLTIPVISGNKKAYQKGTLHVDYFYQSCSKVIECDDCLLLLSFANFASHNHHSEEVIKPHPIKSHRVALQTAVATKEETRMWKQIQHHKNSCSQQVLQKHAIAGPENPFPNMTHPQTNPDVSGTKPPCSGTELNGGAQKRRRKSSGKKNPATEESELHLKTGKCGKNKQVSEAIRYLLKKGWERGEGNDCGTTNTSQDHQSSTVACQSPCSSQSDDSTSKNSAIISALQNGKGSRSVSDLRGRVLTGTPHNGCGVEEGLHTRSEVDRTPLDSSNGHTGTDSEGTQYEPNTTYPTAPPISQTTPQPATASSKGKKRGSRKNSGGVKDPSAPPPRKRVRKKKAAAPAKDLQPDAQWKLQNFADNGYGDMFRQRLMPMDNANDTFRPLEVHMASYQHPARYLPHMRGPPFGHPMDPSMGPSMNHLRGPPFCPPFGPPMEPSMGSPFGRPMYSSHGMPFGPPFGMPMNPSKGPPFEPPMNPSMGQPFGHQIESQQGLQIGPSIGQKMTHPMGAPTDPQSSQYTEPSMNPLVDTKGVHDMSSPLDPRINSTLDQNMREPVGPSEEPQVPQQMNSSVDPQNSPQESQETDFQTHPECTGLPMDQQLGPHVGQPSDRQGLPLMGPPDDPQFGLGGQPSFSSSQPADEQTFSPWTGSHQQDGPHVSHGPDHIQQPFYSSPSQHPVPNRYPSVPQPSCFPWHPQEGMGMFNMPPPPSYPSHPMGRVAPTISSHMNYAGINGEAVPRGNDSVEDIEPNPFMLCWQQGDRSDIEIPQTPYTNNNNNYNNSNNNNSNIQGPTGTEGHQEVPTSGTDHSTLPKSETSDQSGAATAASTNTDIGNGQERGFSVCRGPDVASQSLLGNWYARPVDDSSPSSPQGGSTSQAPSIGQSVSEGNPVPMTLSSAEETENIEPVCSTPFLITVKGEPLDDEGVVAPSLGDPPHHESVPDSTDALSDDGHDFTLMVIRNTANSEEGEDQMMFLDCPLDGSTEEINQATSLDATRKEVRLLAGELVKFLCIIQFTWHPCR